MSAAGPHLEIGVPADVRLDPYFISAGDHRLDRPREPLADHKPRTQFPEHLVRGDLFDQKGVVQMDFEPVFIDDGIKDLLGTPVLDAYSGISYGEHCVFLLRVFALRPNKL